MNPKPFWLLNHLTVPVVIFFSKAHKRTPRDNHAAISTSSMSLEKKPAGTFQQGTAANRMGPIYTLFAVLQGRGLIVRSGTAAPDRARRAERPAFPSCPKPAALLLSAVLLRPCRGRRVRNASIVAETPLRCFAPALEGDVQHRHQENADRTRGKHAAEHCGAHRSSADLGGARRDHERHQAENEGERGHHHGAKAHLRSQ